MYRLQTSASPGETASARLLGSGAILREVIAAAAMLRDDWQVTSEVWSVTSFSELAREARDVERANRLQPGAASRQSHLERCLGGTAPIIVIASEGSCASSNAVQPSAWCSSVSSARCASTYGAIAETLA